VASSKDQNQELGGRPSFLPLCALPGNIRCGSWMSWKNYRDAQRNLGDGVKRSLQTALHHPRWKGDEA